MVFRPSQNIDGLYSIISGNLEWRVPDAKSSENFVRIVGPGEHWGERILSSETRTQGTLTAVEDTRVLVLGRSDLGNLRATFPVVDDYFRSISEHLYDPSLRGAVKSPAVIQNPRE